MNLFRSCFDKRAKYVAVAKRYLEKQRLSILEEGFQSKRGRFDLIALDRKTLVMVSVRLRGCPEAVPDDDEVAEPRMCRLPSMSGCYAIRRFRLTPTGLMCFGSTGTPTGRPSRCCGTSPMRFRWAKRGAWWKRVARNDRSCSCLLLRST